MASGSYFHIVPEGTTGLDLHAIETSSTTEQRKSFQSILILVLLLGFFTVLVSLEQPHQFASICQKYNSANACQIW
ncbi:MULTISPECIES: hypothetical protein [Prochlorococcus]|uniref:hypothetical protein n=1 Tax=Prochlorococcus TaxID=1218 RepID=UPI000561CCEB|nr:MULTISPECIES: hypothetical protein [Prochlorococcus]